MNWGIIWLSWIAGSFIYLLFEMKILDRKYSLRRTILLYALLVCFNCGIKTWSYVVKGVESYSQYAIIPIVAFLIFTLVCFKDKIGKRLLVLFMFLSVSAAAEVIMSISSKVFWNLELQNLFESNIYFNIVIMDHIIIAFFFLLIEMIWKKQEIEKGSRENGCFVLLLAGQILFFIPNVINTVETSTGLTLISLTGVLIGIVFCIMLPVIISETEKRELAEAELEELNRSYELEEVHIRLLEQKQEQIAKMRHDFNNQLTVVMSLINIGKQTDAEEMLQEMKENIEKKDCFVYRPPKVRPKI